MTPIESRSRPAVDLENSGEIGSLGSLPAADLHFAVVVANPSQRSPMNVTTHELIDGPPAGSVGVSPDGLETTGWACATSWVR